MPVEIPGGAIPIDQLAATMLSEIDIPRPESPSHRSRISVVQSKCLDLLVQGHVRSFSKFFNLTHQPIRPRSASPTPANKTGTAAPADPPGGGGGGAKEKPAISREPAVRPPAFEECAVVEVEKSEEQRMAEADLARERAMDVGDAAAGDRFGFVREFTAKTLEDFKQLLITREDAHRCGDAYSIYATEAELGARFEATRELEYAVEHYLVGLDMARKLSDAHAAEINAAIRLGSALQKQGKLKDALRHLEESRDLAMRTCNSQEAKRAAKMIVGVRFKIAEGLEAEGFADQALDHYRGCLAITQAGSSPDDTRMIQQANFRMGKAYQQLGKIDEAVECFAAFADSSAALGDAENQGIAEAALAECYETSGDTKAAIEHLNRLLSLAETGGGGGGGGNAAGRARACSRLGVIYNRIGEYALAIECFDRHFAILSGSGRRGGDAEEWKPAAGAAAAEPRPASGAGNGGTAQVQMGIARANAEMARFLHCVKYDTPDNVASLIHWKAVRDWPPEGKRLTAA